MRRTKNLSNKYLARAVLLGLVTYWVHGVLNYFLDTEKASVPYWGFIGILVALQLNEEEKSPLISTQQPDTQEGDII
jgi:hypothetical protein